MYWKKNAAKKSGLLFGTFLVILFGARFFIEFIKVKQSDITDDWSLNMGHLLSVPFIAIGLLFVIRALVKKNPDSTVES
jgi:prolipoprotein diacylglyceryltransferase